MNSRINRWCILIALTAKPCFAQVDENPTNLEVVQFISGGTEERFAVINGGQNEGILPGAVFQIVRPYLPASAKSPAESFLVEVGRLKTVDLRENQSIARVEWEGSNLSQGLFPKFPGVMVGDTALVPRVTIRKSQQMLPIVTLEFPKVFEDPDENAVNFELSKEGKSQLADLVERLGQSKQLMIIVEGHVNGPPTLPIRQIESQQRAQVVRQYLVHSLQFDEERTFALGLGADELLVKTNIPGSKDKNRRIVIKIIKPPSVDEEHPKASRG